MSRLRTGSEETLVDLPYYSVRNASSPEDTENHRRVLFGHIKASDILDLDTNENVRDYLLEAEGRRRRRPSNVHKAIKETLESDPDNFSVLNGGVTLVARDYEIDEKKKILRLLQPSIINGAQTQGVLKDFYENVSNEEVSPIHITFELIVTDDDALIAEISIARNFQNDVMPISIAGRLGQLQELEERVQQVYPEYKLRQSETQLSDDYIVTERLIQVMTALTPESLWLKTDESGTPNKTYTYSAKAKCLKEFQDVFNKAKDGNPENDRYRKLYKFYLDIAPQAYELHEKWKKHSGFKGSGLRSIHRDEAGNIKEVPDGIVFPVLASLSAFARKTAGGWKIEPPAVFNDQELIDTAVTVYKDVADHNPQTMGKRKACYSQLYQLTSLYRRLTAS